MLMVKTIISNMLHKYSTRLHPFQQRVLPEGFRGRFKFTIEKCIMCRACAVKCPTQCITINTDTGLWAREVLACVYCGVCADVCPTGCIAMTNIYRPPVTEPSYLTFHCKPRVKKVRPNATEEQKQAAVKAAIKEKQKEEQA